MSEQTKQKGMPQWFKLLLVGVAIFVLVMAMFLAYEFTTLNSRIDSNIQFLRGQGFTVERGFFSSFDPFVRVSNITYFVALAHEWNVTTVFVDTGDGEMFFIHQGLIYAHF